MNEPRPVTVWIAEDDDDDRLLIKDALKSVDELHLHFFENGRELLDCLKSTHQPPDLIFLDMEMPLMDGREVIGKTSLNGYRDIPIVCLTTYGNEKDRLYCMEHGAKEYIDKPTSFRELSETLQTLVRKWAK